MSLIERTITEETLPDRTILRCADTGAEACILQVGDAWHFFGRRNGLAMEGAHDTEDEARADVRWFLTHDSTEITYGDYAEFHRSIGRAA
jgi:hypothetical protein